MGLKELRQKAGLRAEDVAISLGVAYSTVRNWEQGRTIPTLGILQTEKLVHLYQCSFEDLVQAVKEVQGRAIA